MRFDYYAATVPEQGRWAIGAILEAFEDSETQVRQCKGMHGYGTGAELIVDDQRAAFCWYNEHDESAHIQASGAASMQIADHIRTIWPQHRVARADVCQDFRGGRPIWTGLRDKGIEIAQHHRIKAREITDPANPDQGRTLYLGAASSVMSARIYEKGLHPEAQLQQIPLDVVRLEFQVRPASRAKAALATLAPNDIPAGSAWSRDLTTQAGLSAGEEWQPGTIWQPTTLDRAVQAMLRQYGNTLDALHDKHGTPEQVGAYLFRQLARLRT